MTAVTAVSAVVEISGKVTELSSPTVLQSLDHLGLFIARSAVILDIGTKNHVKKGHAAQVSSAAEEEIGKVPISFSQFASDYAQLFRRYSINVSQDNVVHRDIFEAAVPYPYYELQL